MPDTPASPWAWSRGNLIGLAVVTALLGGLIVYRALANPARLSESLEVSTVSLQSAGERIDPNTASWASLARLPGIGPGRAKAIVSYREGLAAQDPSQPPFARPADLQKVSGIGPVTVETITPYLSFPGGEAQTAGAKAPE